jgi:hypothetical protein
MAAGVPVVGSNVGGLPAMIEPGLGGFLPEVGDVDGMADCLETLKCDPSLRLAMGKANRERFTEQFHPSSVGSRTLAVYWNLVASAFGAPPIRGGAPDVDRNGAAIEPDSVGGGRHSTMGSPR